MSNESNPSGTSGEPLPEWGASKEKPARNAPPTPPPAPDLSGDDKAWWPGKKEKKPRKRRRLLKIALVLCIAFVLVAGLLIGFAPKIAASMAPGYIEGAAKGQIKGSIKVKKLSLGWGGKQVVGPIELRDDKDKLVGTVNATIPVGLWTIVSEQWWSKKQIDVGQIELSGDLDVVSEADGTTNLDRAVAPGPLVKPKPPKPASGGGGPDIIKGTLKLVALNISYTDKTAPAGSPTATGVGLQRFGGDIAFTYDQSGGAKSTGGLLAKVNLAGSLKGGKAGATDKLELLADVDMKQTANGAIESIKADVTLTGAPIDLVDGLAGFKGTLVKSVGDRAQLKLSASGNLDKMQTTLAAKSDGAQVDLSYLLADSMLTADKPGRLWLRSTDFVAGMPSLQQKFTDLGQTVRLDAGPSVEVNILTFKLPVPKDMLTGSGSSGAKTSFMDLDLRAASFDVKVSVGQQTGSVALDALEGGAKQTTPGTPNAAPVATTPAKMTPFIVEPLVITASAPLLSGPIRVNAATKATLDGKPAGELLVDASAAGLLDAQGKLKPDSLKDLRAQLGLEGTSTALLQPISKMLNLPIEMSQDIGPTVDLEIKANSLEAVSGNASALGAGISGIPPLDASWRLISRNINSDGSLRVTDKLTTTGDGIVLRVGSAGPLVQRFLASGKKDASPGATGGGSGGGIEVAGVGKIDLTVKDLSLDMSKLVKKPGDANSKPLGIEDIQARADVRIDDLSVTVIPAAPPVGSSSRRPKSSLPPSMTIVPPPAPIILSRTSLLATLKPGEAPNVTLDSALSHEGAPFTLTARASAPASVLSKSSAAPGSVPNAPSNAVVPKNIIEQVIGYQATVRVDLKNAPRSLTKVVPSLATAIEPGDGKDTSAEVKRLISSLLGGTVDVVIESSPEPAGVGGAGANTAASQRAKIDVKSAGATAVVAANLKPDSIAVQQMTLDANLTPANTNPLLAAVSTPAPPPAAPAPANPAAPNAPSTNKPGDLRPANTITKPGTPNPPANTTPTQPAKPTLPMTLAEAFTLRAAIDPFILPIETKNGSPGPKWSAAPEIVAKLTTSAPITLRNLPVGEGKESASVRNLNVISRVPLAGVMAETEAAKALAMVPTKVTADLVRPSYAANAAQGAAGGDLFANLDVDAQIPAGKGNLSAVVQLKDVNTGIAESILGKPSYLVGALGDRLQAKVRFEQQTIAGNADAKRAEIRADLESARLKGGSIHATMDDQAIRADSAKLTWTPSVEWANLYMLGGEAAKAQKVEPGAQLTQETTFTLDLKKLAIATSKKDGEKSIQGPLKPGVFALDTTLSAPSMTLKRPDGKTVRLDDIRATLASRDAPGSIGFDVNIAKVSGEGSDVSKSSHLAGTIDKLCDAAGNVTSDTAELTTNGNLDSLPTALVDALANQKGLLVDALGSIVTLNVKADHLSQKSGSLQLSTTAPRATTSIQGSIQNNIFTQTGTIEVNIIEVVEPLVKRFAGGLPLVESVVKTPQDTKGLIKTENFTAPADGKDMSQLNGTITVALGTARFEAVGLFSQLLKLTGGKQSGAVGQKIEPFVIKADHGVLTYERFSFPLGEFAVETKGTVDLVNRTVSVVAYVPLFALADETLGMLGGNLLGNNSVLDRNTLVPIKVSGPMDKPKIEPDVETFAKDNAAKLLPDPKKVLEDPKKAIDDFLKNIKKGK